MRLNEVSFTDSAPVDGYGPGVFRIGGNVVQGAVVTGPTGTHGWAGFEEIETLVALKDYVDVVFLGTGSEVAHAPAPLRAALEEAGIGVEVMTSPAAARTYNVLLSEGRRIALAMLPVD